ncbi:hypothetical protein A3I18_02640 [Candidatus Campbellbacteria bacterium RIFCSPLOWO2_02_FULL_35_11]|uniref:Uncharacterized protein n=2 Tax=Candidatus Campbelliibacteriota TaxID=1752727 RepID=A0A1F5EL89_9BACT|nr:MAG: hypothetical protein A3E89_02545 [Candidatus Campbellbacteria bacterium RIFCSPHIGHO2_12_FULL_35_10]OGD70383.1 MAG: hypothetical protein A3I18_02640 [Candidatus Campbellbacteria bacterium RIFCSPLOWO2_02_FULL_35_11]
MHPLGIDYEDYLTALAINKIQDIKEKTIQVVKWEKETGNEFPWVFPRFDLPRPSDERELMEVLSGSNFLK